ncbi:MAG: hypothetical protein IMW93_07540 [Thermoanaerobacteraceae bacterium]|nr:hypothetical protein [Thermoanaerobacteraceae bacterium]
MAEGGITRRAKRFLARSEFWEKFVSWLEEVRDALISLSQIVSEHRIELPENRHITLLKSELEELEAYLVRGKKVGMLAKILKPRFKYLMENCLVDGIRIASTQEIRLVLKELERRQLVEKLHTRWQNEIVAVGGPELSVKGSRLPAEIDEYARIIKKAFEWKKKLWTPLAEEIQRIGLTVPYPITPDTVREGMTMGVISLLGTAQARLINELLLERLGPARCTSAGFSAATPTSSRVTSETLCFFRWSKRQGGSVWQS